MLEENDVLSNIDQYLSFFPEDYSKTTESINNRDIITCGFENRIIETSFYITILRVHVQSKQVFLDVNVIYSVPKFHAYAHSITCRKFYYPMYIDGTGNTDGEACKRAWSYLGKFSSIVKYSSSGNRLDQVLYTVYRYNQTLLCNLAKNLKKKLKNLGLFSNFYGCNEGWRPGNAIDLGNPADDKEIAQAMDYYRKQSAKTRQIVQSMPIMFHHMAAILHDFFRRAFFKTVKNPA